MPPTERRSMKVALPWLAVFLVTVIGCAAPPTPSTSQRAPEPAQTSGPKRLVAAIIGDPYTLSATVNSAGAGGQPGVEEVERLIHSGLAIRNDRGALTPQLAASLPTLENGQWRVLQDGHMEMTWTISPRARWHDGTPLTAADLLFSVQVGQDKDLPLFRHPAYDSLESVEAPNAATVVAKWKAPYIWADDLFASTSTGRPALATPLPRH